MGNKILSPEKPKLPISLITEGEVRPFEDEIMQNLHRQCEIHPLHGFSELSKGQTKNLAVVICEVPHRIQESDQRDLLDLLNKVQKILVFYIVPDEFSTINLLSDNKVVEATLHRAYGNYVSQVDARVIQNKILTFIKGNKRVFVPKDSNQENKVFLQDQNMGDPTKELENECKKGASENGNDSSSFEEVSDCSDISNKGLKIEQEVDSFQFTKCRRFCVEAGI